MLALSPHRFPTLNWPLGDPISQEHNFMYAELAETSDLSGLLHSPLSKKPQFGHTESNNPASAQIIETAPMAKKLNHNANERDRRKRMNTLYSSLRSLLPTSDHSKKLSIPATVSRVVKYIPELQKEMESLIQKKEELLSRKSRQEHMSIYFANQGKGAIESNLAVVSASKLSDREVMFQIATGKTNKSLLSEALHMLEENGLMLIDASSFHSSFGERSFYNLHLQVLGSCQMEFDLLRKKLLSFYRNKEQLFS